MATLEVNMVQGSVNGVSRLQKMRISLYIEGRGTDWNSVPK